MANVDWTKRTYKQALATLLCLALMVLLLYAIYPYKNAFFGAFILFAVLRPLNRFLTMRLKIGSDIAAVLVILIAFLIILVPFFLLFTVVMAEAQNLIVQVEYMPDLDALPETIRTVLNDIISLLPPDIDLKEKAMGMITKVAVLFSESMVGLAKNTGKIIIDLTIMLFLLFYMLTGERSAFSKSLRNAIPFNEENTTRLFDEFGSMVKTMLISTGAIALIQGALLTITFLIFGLKGAFLWGSITVLLSFLPVVGPPFIWVPASLIQLLQQDYVSAAGVFAGGVILSSVDNFIRPAIGKKVGELHPLVSLVGVIIGIDLFGLLGIIIGPLLISYTLLVARMFNEEYMS